MTTTGSPVRFTAGSMVGFKPIPMGLGPYRPKMAAVRATGIDAT